MSVRVVAVPQPHLHAAAVVVALRGGPRFEGPRECGLTHFLEHMIFRGAGEHREPRALMAAFEETGDEPLAHTADDEIVLSVLAAPEKLGRAARLLADVLLRPAFRHLERERRIILEERHELVDREGEPTDLDDVSRRLVFEGHPLERPLLGEERDIRRYGRAHLERHRRALVRDGNLVVAVAGPVGPSAVRAVRGAFRSVPAGPALEGPPVVTKPGPRLAHVRLAGAPQCDARLSFAAAGEDDPRAPALRVLANVLDGGPTARLPVQLVDAGYVYSAEAGLATAPDVSLLELDLAVSTARFAETFERALAVVAALRRGIADEEVARARARILLRRELARDDARLSAEWAARRALFGQSTDRDAALAAIARVATRDVLAVAREVLRPERLAVALVGDLSKGALAGARRAVARFAARVS